MALAFLSCAAHLQADPLDRWTWRYPRPQGCTLRAVTCGNGLYVAVGDSGTIITSGDGYNWTNQSYGTFPFLSGVAYADGEFAAVGPAGAIITSSNGTDWVQQPQVTTNSLYGIGGNSLWRSNSAPRFLAVGDLGTTVWCSDVTIWTMGGVGTTNGLYGVTWRSNCFLVVGEGGTVVRTTGQVWSPSPSGTTNSLYGVAYGNPIATACGDLNQFGPINTNAIMYSTNSSRNWSSQTWAGPWGGVPDLWFPSQAFILHSMAFGTNRFVAVGDTGWTLEFMYPGVVLTSDTGTNWTELSAETSENRLYGVTYGNGLFVAVGDAGGILVSPDGLTWTEVTGYHRSAIRAIACAGGLYLASGQPICHAYSSFPDLTSLVSSNGTDWVVSTTNPPTMNDLAGSGKIFVGVSGGCICTTTNGFGWTSNCLSANTLRGVGWGKGQFAVVGDAGTIYTSADGFNWNNHSIAPASNLNCVAYGNGQYVAAGSVVASSVDGVSWSLTLTNPPATFGRLIYANGLFVATAYVGPSYSPTGEILSSPDGVNWQLRYSLAGGTVSGLAYTSGIFLAISEYGAILKSLNGIDWTPAATLPLVDGGAFHGYYTGNYSACLCAWDGRFIAAGLDGIMMQSDDIKVPILSGSTRIKPLGVTFSFNPESGASYRIQTSTNLDIWQNLYQGIGRSQPTRFIDFTPRSSARRFFRVVSP